MWIGGISFPSTFPPTKSISSGGVIDLDNGESITLTESEVLDQDIQHGAGVTFQLTANGKRKVDIIFQGENQSAPVKSYYGYIALGEHHKWYCVDGTDPDQRFVIDERDLDLIPKRELVPCLFNVMVGGDKARISRVYSDQTVQKKKDLKKNQKQKKDLEKIPKPEEKIEPYLEGCKIVIVGGLRKWFEEVVHETGAELIHDDGKTPHRIYPELSKASVLILHYANKHNATWGSVHVAKSNHIPILKISGSKSNLKSLLWENRDQIKDQRWTAAM